MPLIISILLHKIASSTCPKALMKPKRERARPEAHHWKAPPDITFTHDVGFVYRRSSSTDCRICFAARQCYIMNFIRCEYYLQTTKILADEDIPTVDSNPQLRAEIDSMMYSVIEKAQEEIDFQDCVPYISRYTDCTKDNICLGCKTCDCDALGRWNCSVAQECRPDLVKPVADHRTLVMVVENLKQTDQFVNLRAKRSLDDQYHDVDDDDISHAKLSEWINGEPTLRDASLYAEESEQEPNLLEPTRTIKQRSKNGTKLLKMIVNSLINDALPGVFKETEYENNRVKRWVGNNTKAEVINKITFEELSDWLNHVHPYVYVKDGKNSTNKKPFSTPKTNSKAKFVKTTTKAVPKAVQVATANPNPEYLAFEEVYNNIVVDNKNYSRKRKPPAEVDMKAIDLDFNMYDDNNYLQDIDSSKNSTVDVSNARDIINKISVTSSTTIYKDYLAEFLPSVTEVVVNLLESPKKTNSAHSKDETYMNNIDLVTLNKFDYLNAVNIMKREVPTIVTPRTVNLNTTTTRTTTVKPNATNPAKELKDGVLDPLDKILKDKQHEIADLLKIREKLVAFIKKFKQANVKKAGKNAFVSVYKLEVMPHHHHDYRRSNSSILDKYLINLKKDIYEVVKDLVTIRKLYGHANVPDNLNFLTRALKHYIHKETDSNNKTTKLPIHRRYNVNPNLVKEALVNVIESLDRNMPKASALIPLSPHTKRVLKRIIKKNYVDEYANTGLRVYDPHYNLTKDLSSIGTQWQMMTSQIEKSTVADRLYNMKKLQLILAVDIAKMNDALALIDFARSRRMIPVDELLGEKIMANIDKSLDSVNVRMYKIINAQTKQIAKSKPRKKYRKKDSFLKQIKNLLHNSKSEVLKLWHKQIPKSDIVKEIARKNVEELTKKKLEETMQKWQTNLNVLSDNIRSKRSSNDYDKLRRRIKNIIPKYLRGKVHPALNGKKVKNKKKNITGSYKKVLNKTGSKHTTKFTITKHTTMKHPTKKHTTTKPITTKHAATKITTTKHTTIPTSMPTAAS
ncbi:uncharacterized protein LOC126376830 [Pectinophora gossypiella]|uniref:uncharacterized protein LOC126376830 n=1 Tax=Pectinophora gossypiella TaxID=13191 RepID=UPI00214EABB2|nr:uncharacterized protein LOC126376830 [Pectinophora gossypiella]